MATEAHKRRNSAVERLVKMQNSFVEPVLNFVETTVQKYPILDDTVKKIQDVTGIKNRYFIFGLALLPMVLISMPILINLLTIAYPLLMSVKAIEKGKDARTRWLIYWLLFHTLNLLEFSLGWILLSVFGGFQYLKFVYLFWCMAPTEQNGCWVSYRLLQPVLSKHVGMADTYISEVSDQVTSQVETVWNDNQDLIRGAAMQAAITVAVNQPATSTPRMEQVDE